MASELNQPSNTALRKEAFSTGTCFALGASVTAGWVLHDCAAFLTSGEPRMVLDLLPASCGAILGAGLLAALLAKPPRALVVSIVLLSILGGAVFPAIFSPYVPDGLRVLPRVVAVLLAAGLTAAFLGRFAAFGGARAGMALGALGCAGFHSHSETLYYDSPAIIAGALIALALGFVTSSGWRRLSTLVVLLAAAAPSALATWNDIHLARPDQAHVTNGQATGQASTPNLLLIVLDTVRADHLSVYGYERETMPALTRFAREKGIVYEQARSTSSWTLPSHASLLTGLLPGQHGASHPRRTESDIIGIGAWPALPIHDDVGTLAERLRSASYRTAATVSNDVYLNHRYGLDRGFEHYDDRHGGWVGPYLALVQFAGFVPQAGHLLYRDASRITHLALQWIDSWHEAQDAASPFFLMLNYMDAHSPYHPPPPFDAAFSDAQPRDPYRSPKHLRSLLYDRELLYLDSELDRLFTGLEGRGLLEDTVVIITSDHGEALGQHGFWLHGWTLYDEVVRVPLIVKPVGPRENAVQETPIAGHEVHNLALTLLGLESLHAASPAHIHGEWFQLEHVPNSPMLGDQDLSRDLVSWVAGNVKTIVNSLGEVEMFDLGADPREEHPLSISEDEHAAALERAQRWWKENPPRTPTALGAFDTEAIDRLEGLGYTGDPSQD